MSCKTKKSQPQNESPNAPDVRDVVGTTVLAIVCGFTRYVHINRLRNDTALAALLGLGRIVCEDSVRRALKSADGRELDAWLARHEKDVFDRLLSFQYVIDIDNTVKPIFGHQEGAELGYNPQKPGRPSHNFHSYFIGSIRISLGVDVLPGKRHSGICGTPRLWEIIDGLPPERRPRLLRGDVGYGGDENMCEAEKRGLMYLFKIRRTKTVLALLRQYEDSREWIDAGEGWEALEVGIRLGGWKKSRRGILLRRPSKDVKRIEPATKPRRRGRPKKNAPELVQGEFEFVEDRVGRCWDCSALVTDDGKLNAAEALRVENGKPLPKQRKRAEIHCLKRRFASSNWWSRIIAWRGRIARSAIPTLESIHLIAGAIEGSIATLNRSLVSSPKT